MFQFVSSRLADCYFMELPKVHNPAGNITAINNNKDIPFEVNRVYYLYDIPGGAKRGGHAHKELFQLIVAASGSFEVLLHDGKNQESFFLNQPYQGLIIVPGIWRELQNFSAGSICLVLASNFYNTEDYIRDFEEFLKIKNI